MSPTPTRLALDWATIHADCATLAARLAAAGPFAGLVAVTRGGLVPAALLARALDLRRIETLGIVSYDESDRQGELTVVKPPGAVDGDGRGWLVVDDLADSGATLALARRLLPAARVATLYVKPAGQSQVDWSVRSYPSTVWIAFPWEQDSP